MTCIVGLVDTDGSVWMGGDSAGVDGYDLRRVATPKVFQVGPCLIGYTSSFRMGQLLQFAFTVPALGDDLPRYMATTFVDAVRDCLKTGGYARKTEEAESAGRFLVGVRGHLFMVDSDYHAAEMLDPYNAVGGGDAIALGALRATSGLLSAAERVQRALEAAATYNIGVVGPFTILHLAPEAP